ncbi:VOC family protein [Hyphomicrobium sp.]|uniref:VOC family protein n=1 Tax=Hyphomicrobium sp. TaxID=82 RepID=UPI0025BC14FF|nr:VOC family protein [Hyphomicrobium sp.]
MPELLAADVHQRRGKYSNNVLRSIAAHNLSACYADDAALHSVEFQAFMEVHMNRVQVEQQSYQMPPEDGFTVARFLTVADIERSARFYETVFGGRILSRGDSSGAPGYIQIANTWLLVNVGGGPTPDKPSVTLSVPADPDSVSSFMNIRVADIQACFELWKSRGAEFIAEPKEKYGETRCYIRDPDGYIIEVGQRKPDFIYG